MQTYVYTARDRASGKKVKAEIEADSENGAAKLLQERGINPIEITDKSGKKSPLDVILKRIPTKDKVIFSRQLSTLINAGLPIIQSLQTVADQTTNKKLKEVIGKVIADIEAGSALADALAKYPKVFNKVYVSLIAAGETSGTLDVALERLANQQEKDAEIVSKVRGAMIYPMIVLLVMLMVIIFMLTTVLPQVQTLYDGLPGVKLPIITRVLLKCSYAITHFWWVLLAVLGFMSVITTRWARTVTGRRIVDRLKMKAWPVGPLFTKLYMARFSRTGATLVGSGVPLLQMLNITADAVNNVLISDAIHAASEKVKGGKALSDSLEGNQFFPDLVPNMIHIGEQSGALETMLGKCADYYEKEVDTQIKNISTLVEPVLMIIMGIVAFMIVAAVLLPIYGLVGHVGVNGIK
jgi:type IV pilus assembly protein PilC